MRFFVLIFLFYSLISISGHTTELEIIHLNIGQGDATLILGPTAKKRKAVLIDAGDTNGPDGGKVIVDYLTSRGINSLTAVIATHYDRDHIGGLITRKSGEKGKSLGRRLQDGGDGKPHSAKDPASPRDDIVIKMLVDRGDCGLPEEKKGPLKYYLEYANKHSKHVTIDSREQLEKFIINLGAGAQLKVIASNGYVLGRNEQVDKVDTENEKSLVFLLSYKKFHYLIGGDSTGRKFGSENAKVEQAVAEYLIDKRINLDVLQVNHHGSNNGTAADFLEMMKPEIAIISAGHGNNYGHPNTCVLLRLADARVKRIYVTTSGATKWNSLKKCGEIKNRKHQEVQFMIKDKLIHMNNHILLTSDGNSYRITYHTSTSPFTLPADG